MSWRTLLEVNVRSIPRGESAERTFCLNFNEPEEHEAVFLEGELSWRELRSDQVWSRITPRILASMTQRSEVTLKQGNRKVGSQDVSTEDIAHPVRAPVLTV